MTLNVYTIPPGRVFMDDLVAGLKDRLGTAPENLTRALILLPTRRACRSLRHAFLKESNGTPMLLPRMAPIGDVDEDELSLLVAGMEGSFELPPAMPELQRRILLARLIAAQGYGRSFEQDLALAQALGHLMDQVYTEDLNFSALPGLVDQEDFAEHWQISLSFLHLLSHHWPLILQDRGMIDSADRRNRLMTALGNFWDKAPPDHPVFAAGSTGTIPAARELLRRIATMDKGGVILPGLDQDMDEESWQALSLSETDTHPQKTLHTLLERFGIDRAAVRPWFDIKTRADHQTKQNFIREVMRPAQTTHRWQNLQSVTPFEPEKFSIERYDCDTPQEEAMTIAIALRSALEPVTHPDGTKTLQTAALVTPDRTLAERVSALCRRWGIALDDSAGQPLVHTQIGRFLMLCFNAALENFNPVATLDFCKHALCSPAVFQDWRSTVRLADRLVFRAQGLEKDLIFYRAQLEGKLKSHPDIKTLINFFETLDAAFAPLTQLLSSDHTHPFAAWQEAHLAVAEFFCPPEFLWAGEAGEQAADLLSGLMECADDMPDLGAADYSAFFRTMMAGVSVRPRFGAHPRLSILGTLEARLISADVLILGGLNEGTWPAAPPADPWMSRAMRKKFNLPPLERGIGLSAHDFAQAFSAPRVILTRAKRVDGTPTVPSRWLQRMETVLEACGCKEAFSRGPLLNLARQIDRREAFPAAPRPAPCPPVADRPRTLPVTAIDTWLVDPYQIYARYILKLRKLHPLDPDADQAFRGIILHAVMEKYTADFEKTRTPDARVVLFMDLAREEMKAQNLSIPLRLMWEPRLLKIAQWLADQEAAWREDYKPALKEKTGTLTLETAGGPFTLTARADRIDLRRDGSAAAILDYKSGKSKYSAKAFKNGDLPQLPLEALIVREGGFSDLKKIQCDHLAYWILSGGKSGPSTVTLEEEESVSSLVTETRDMLLNLIGAFDDERQPYLSLPFPDRFPAGNDYEHLARVREWTALNEVEEDAA